MPPCRKKWGGEGVAVPRGGHSAEQGRRVVCGSPSPPFLPRSRLQDEVTRLPGAAEQAARRVFPVLAQVPRLGGASASALRQLRSRRRGGWEGCRQGREGKRPRERRSSSSTAGASSAWRWRQGQRSLTRSLRRWFSRTSCDRRGSLPPAPPSAPPLLAPRRRERSIGRVLLL